MRKILILLLLVIFSLNVFSYEANLSVFGFETKNINSFNESECQTINVDILKEATINLRAPILSINALFVGEKSDNSFVSVKINDSKTIYLWPENFSCKDSCFARVFVPDLLDGETKLKICLKTGGKSTAKILDTSKIGFYASPLLFIENISPEEITLGQRAKMTIKVSNSGSVSQKAFVQFVAEDLRTFIQITSFDIVEGEASAQATINAGETKEFVYYIKPTKTSSYNLPSAIIFFDNIFGEKQQIASNHPQLEVSEPKQIDIAIIGSKTTNGEMRFNVIIKNKWNESFDGELNLFPSDIFLESKQIVLSPLEEKTILFETTNLIPGHYSVMAQLNDSNEVSYLSESISFYIADNDYLFEIIFAIIAILISAGIFVLIYFKL